MRDWHNMNTRELFASAFGKRLPWLGIALLLPLPLIYFLVIGGGSYFFGPNQTIEAREPAFEMTSRSTADELDFCLSKNSSGRLTLQRVRNPPPSVAVRFYNPVLHITVDVLDRGADRLASVYSRDGGSLGAEARAAFLFCGERYERAKRPRPST